VSAGVGLDLGEPNRDGAVVDGMYDDRAQQVAGDLQDRTVVERARQQPARAPRGLPAQGRSADAAVAQAASW
jgi:hypothetical protein